MKFLRLYTRVLELLGPESALGWTLARCQSGTRLRAIHRTDPVRTHHRSTGEFAGRHTPSRLDRPLAAGRRPGSASALFIIVCSTLVALHADRLAHRHAQKIRTDYFEHVLQLPLSYHTGTHSGRLMKVMITGTNTLWSLWLAFFRQHLASFVSLLILMPLTLFLNWRFGVLLMILCAIFGDIDRARSLQKRKAAEHGRALLFRHGRANHRHVRKYRIDPELRPRRGRGDGDEEGRRPVARRPDAGAVLVGRSRRC